VSTAAPPVLAFRRRLSGAPLALDPALEIGVGGEARVLGVPGDESLVAKLYHQPTLERARKLARMIEAPPALEGGAALAWPVDLLTDPNGRFAGFLMPRAEGPRVFEFYNPASRRRAAPLSDWGLLHRAGMNLAAAFDALHGRGYVVGDVNESNILVSPENASVTLVDTDSFQVRDPAGGAVHRSGVGKAEFTPPELQGTRFTEVDRAPEHDRFGLAVLLFLLLMEGTHPFAQRFEGDAESLPVEERIRRGLYPYERRDDDCKPPRLAPPIETLHPRLQALFARCFVDGRADPAARPSAAEWRDALAAAEGELRACDENPRHRFAAHVPFCPWCHRRRVLQRRDPFPASVELARATDGAPVAGKRAALPQHWTHPPAPAAARVPGIPVSILPQPVAVAPPNAFLAQLQAALPPSIAGPTALGSPFPWLAPAALTVVYGFGGELRILGMAVGYVALRGLFRSGLGSFTARTVGWVVGMLLFWFVLSGVAGMSYPPDDDYDIIDYAPSQPVQSPPSPRTDAYEQVDVDVPPVLRNRDAVASAMDEALRSRKYPGPAEEQLVTQRFVVNQDGSVDMWTVTVVNAPSAELAAVAREVTRSMWFEPGVEGGQAVPTWTEHTLTFPARGP
jgi:hypothetical protein